MQEHEDGVKIYTSAAAVLLIVLSGLMASQEISEKTILIVGVVFGVLALCVLTLILCCLYWRRQLEKDRARGNSKLGYSSEFDKNVSAGATSQLDVF